MAAGLLDLAGAGASQLGTSSTAVEEVAMGRALQPRENVSRASSPVAVAVQYHGMFGIPQCDWFNRVCR